MGFASTTTPEEIEQAARENSLAMIRQTIPDDLLYEIESNSAYEVQKKLHDYFDAGVSRVWVVYPDQAEVYVYSSPKQIEIIGLGQELDGGDLIPGFRLPVAVLFQDDPE